MMLALLALLSHFRRTPSSALPFAALVAALGVGMLVYTLSPVMSPVSSLSHVKERFDGGKDLGDWVMTWYTFQDNTPCNSTATASTRALVPYVSVAVPFRFLKSKGGDLDYGDKLFVSFLQNRTMPNGTKHTGWVQIDDFCGDGGDDLYCYQTVGGKQYPNVDLYIGDYTKSGVNCSTTGPPGSGQEITKVSVGQPPSGAWVTDYGGAARGGGKCGDCSGAKQQQSCQWHYTPSWEGWWTETCKQQDGMSRGNPAQTNPADAARFVDGWRLNNGNPLGDSGYFCGPGNDCLEDCTYVSKGALRTGGEACPESHSVPVENTKHPDWACTTSRKCRGVFNKAAARRR